MEILEFTIDKTGPKRFSKLLALKNIAGLNLAIGASSIKDYQKFFSDIVDRRSWIMKMLHRVPVVGDCFRKFSASDHFTSKSVITIMNDGEELVLIPTKFIPLHHPDGPCFKIGFKNLPVTVVNAEISIEWTENPSVSEPIQGAVIVIGEAL